MLINRVAERLPRHNKTFGEHRSYAFDSS